MAISNRPPFPSPSAIRTDVAPIEDNLPGNAKLDCEPDEPDVDFSGMISVSASALDQIHDDSPEVGKKTSKKALQMLGVDSAQTISAPSSSFAMRISPDMMKSAVKATAVFFGKCLASILLVALLIPVGILDSATRAISLNRLSLWTPALLPATFVGRNLLKPKGLDLINLELGHFPTVTELSLTTEDGKTLEGFHIDKSTSYPKDQPRRLAIVCCANAENCRNTNYIRAVCNELCQKPTDSDMEWQPPTDFLFFNYRGVGGSAGLAVHTHDLILDGKAAMAWATETWNKQHGYTDASNILLHGRSIGGGVAAALAAQYPEADVKLKHTFKSWSKAVNDITSPYVFKPLTKLMEYVSMAIGGNQLSPEKHLNQRHLLPLGLSPKGRLWVQKAQYDELLGMHSSLSRENLSDLPRASLHFEDTPTRHLG